MTFGIRSAGTEERVQALRERLDTLNPASFMARAAVDACESVRQDLVGDAAHVPAPMTGSGFSMVAAGAEAVAAGLQEQGMAPALERCERTRLATVRRSVESGQQFSRSFTGHSS
ncbi:MULTISPECIES: hypothetical protein [unclassified Streptomyces]|uniref:hypothetical protein n=1 Tax=unclassified Streptomyces TaxID=2593676 RepID=UPI0007ED3DA0|nr:MULTISPECIES: hypothetical protein [unclassified Streptomyces]MCP3769112.1 hypothetical protein [Streptomyces sp. MAR25Y5]OBQ50514.1 hypothetical protein A4U61_10005 [Streptomyces sp. H-KF8]